MILTVTLLCFAYLLGSIPTGLWIGRIIYHKDLHEEGSGNTGTTNTFRILGIKAGILTFIGDILKGTIATLLPLLLHETLLPALIFGLVAVIGHTFSIFDHFRGGKAVATSAGVILAYNPLFVIYLLIVFFIVLLLFSMVSLSSIIAALFAIIGIVFFPAFHFILPHYDLLFSLIVTVLALIIIIRHISNIQRILSKTENTVSFGLNISRQQKKTLF